MAGRTLALIRARGKLSVMRIGRVTIRAFRKCERFLEIAFRVTLNAIDLRVLT